MIWGILIILVVVAILSYGSISISSGIYLKTLCRQSGAEGEFAITFDDGVDPVITPQVLDTLDRHGAKATFFIVGERAELYPELVAEIDRRGHSVGNHSFYHRGSFPMQRQSVIEREIKACGVILQSILGREVKLFRPPFGVTNPMIAGAVKSCGLTVVGWSVRSFDTMGHPLERVEKRVVTQLKSGSILLLHDNREGAEVLLDRILNYTDGVGLRSVTIEKLFKMR